MGERGRSWVLAPELIQLMGYPGPWGTFMPRPQGDTFSQRSFPHPGDKFITFSVDPPTQSMPTSQPHLCTCTVLCCACLQEPVFSDSGLQFVNFYSQKCYLWIGLNAAKDVPKNFGAISHNIFCIFFSFSLFLSSFFLLISLLHHIARCQSPNFFKFYHNYWITHKNAVDI